MRIFTVTFMEYINQGARIKRDDLAVEDNDPMTDIPVPDLIKECDIPFYKQYGGGIRDLHYVGELNMDDLGRCG